jgi:DNA-binding MarR family transcriptional regulator
MKKHSLQDDIGYWLNRLRMKIHASFEAKLEAYGITVPQWCVLISIYNNDGETVSELAHFIDVDKGFVSRIVEQLVGMGLLGRQEGKDRRVLRIQLTAKAKTLTEQLIDCAEHNEKEFFLVLTEAEKRSLQKIFSKLLKNAGIEKLGGFIKNG